MLDFALEREMVVVSECFRAQSLEQENEKQVRSAHRTITAFVDEKIDRDLARLLERNDVLRFRREPEIVSLSRQPSQFSRPRQVTALSVCREKLLLIERKGSEGQQRFNRGRGNVGGLLL